MDEVETGRTTTVADRVVRRAVVLAVLGVAGVFMLKVASAPISDPDTWWNMRLGQDLSATGLQWTSVQHWSPFATADWAPHSGLSDIFLAQFDEWFGLPGIAWLYGVALLAMLGAGYLCCRCVASDLPAAFATSFLLLGASGSLSARPQMVSFVLLPVVVCVWLRTEKDRVPRWWLIPLTWVWAMCHGYWFIGVLVGLTFAGGMALQDRFSGRRLITRESARWLAVPLLSLCAAMLTPVGPELALGPARVNERGALVEEGRRTAFDRAQPWLVVLMILIVVLVWIARRHEASIARLGLLVMAGGWLVITERTVAVAAVLMAPLLASALQELIANQDVRGPWATKRGVLSFVGLSAVGLGVLALVVPHTADEAGDVPTAFESVLDAQPEHSVILNDYSVGGWLAWQFPHLDVVVDPLCDAYSVTYLEKYIDTVHVRGDWREFVATVDPDLAVLHSDEPLARALKADAWHVEATDGPFVLMTPPSA